MSRWRIGVVVGLLLMPLLLWAAVGSYYLWTLHWGIWAWWVMAVLMGTGYGLAWYWQQKRQLLQLPGHGSPLHWTERDAQAWKIVEARADAAERLAPALLSDVNYYLKAAQELATELARAYYPRTSDPIDSVTLPEILTVIELAMHDLGELVDRYVPGGHLLTVRDWRRARQATEWYQSASKVWWLVSALFSPLETATRYAASRAGLSGPWQQFQQNLLLWFHQAYLHRLGNYLIELYSGRLRVGARRYREILGQGPHEAAAAPGADQAVVPRQQVAIALVGQVKAGKSSLVNALLGERRAVCDVLPATSGVERYEVKAEGFPASLLLFDTPGYGHAGPKDDQLDATRAVLREADIVFLVLHATNPGRQADLDLANDLRRWLEAHPEYKRPPVIAVLTHVDLLSPSLEWSPPYNWRRPSRPKEVRIREAAQAALEQLGESVAAVVPVCTAPGKVYGIDEDLLPAVATRLDEARGVALLRCLRTEADEGKVRKVFQQLLALGQEAARFAWQRMSS
jgi:predicted GTPase